jgi:Inhibitor of growth proteins N-terminal histone-binding
MRYGHEVATIIARSGLDTSSDGTDQIFLVVYSEYVIIVDIDLPYTHTCLFPLKKQFHIMGEETYLESFIEQIHTLPSEVRRNLDLMKDLDKTCA